MKLTGGSKFEDAIKELVKKLDKPYTLRVGFLEGATYPDGTKVAEVAIFNEFGRTVTVTRKRSVKNELGGSYYQLPRPFFRNMIAEKSSSWPKGIAYQLKATNYDVELTLVRAGQKIKAQLQKSIRDLKTPPLAPSTIRRKGFSKPLIDTGQMLKSVDYEIETQ